MKPHIICAKKHTREKYINLNRDFGNVCVHLINRPNGPEEILISKGTENILEIEYDQIKEEGRHVEFDLKNF